MCVLVVTLGLALGGGTAFAKDKGENPSGWGKGEKKGWVGNMPPGLEKKDAQKSERQMRKTEREAKQKTLQAEREDEKQKSEAEKEAKKKQREAEAEAKKKQREADRQLEKAKKFIVT